MRPEYVKCIGLGTEGSSESWCGRTVPASEWHFLDASHAALNARNEGRLLCCTECVTAIVATLTGHTPAPNFLHEFCAHAGHITALLVAVQAAEPELRALVYEPGDYPGIDRLVALLEGASFPGAAAAERANGAEQKPEPASEDDHPTESARPWPCGWACADGFLCTLPSGHGGDHVALGLSGKPLRSWPSGSTAAKPPASGQPWSPRDKMTVRHFGDDVSCRLELAHWRCNGEEVWSVWDRAAQLRGHYTTTHLRANYEPAPRAADEEQSP